MQGEVRLTSWIERYRDAAAQHRLSTVIYLIVLCGFFLLDTQSHRSIYYLLLAPFALTMDRTALRAVFQLRFVWLASAYLAYLWLSVFWSEGLSFFAALNELRKSVLLLAFLFGTLHLARTDPAFIDRVFFWLAITAGITGTAAIVGHSTGLYWHGTQLVGFGRADHPIIGATLYGLVCLAALFYLLPRATGYLERAAYGTVTIVTAAFVFLTESRGPLFALIAALVIGVLVQRRRAFLIVLPAFGTLFGLLVLTGLLDIQLMILRGTGGRLEIWDQVLSFIAERPWFGHGVASPITFLNKGLDHRSPHNLFLANQFYGGIPATLLLLALIGAGILLAVKEAYAGRPVFLSLVVFGLVCAFFDTRTVVLNLSREWLSFWFPLLMLVARFDKTELGSAEGDLGR